MLRLLGGAVKLVAFSIAVLVLGQLLTWKGKSLSDQVRLQISHAERFRAVKKGTDTLRELNLPAGTSSDPTGDQISKSEREKLRSLIGEINDREGAQERKRSARSSP